MALSRSSFYGQRVHRAGREFQNPLRCKAFATDSRQAPLSEEGALEHWCSEEEQAYRSLTHENVLMFSMGL